MIALGLLSLAGSAHILLLSETKGKPIPSNIVELDVGEQVMAVQVDKTEAK
jgi:hypothetical protein